MTWPHVIPPVSLSANSTRPWQFWGGLVFHTRSSRKESRLLLVPDYKMPKRKALFSHQTWFPGGHTNCCLQNSNSGKNISNLLRRASDEELASQLNQPTVSKELETKSPLELPALGPESSARLESRALERSFLRSALGATLRLPGIISSSFPAPAAWTTSSTHAHVRLSIVIDGIYQAPPWGGAGRGGAGPRPAQRGALLKKKRRQMPLRLLSLSCPCSFSTHPPPPPSF